MTIGLVKDAGRNGHPSTSWSEENVATVREMFICSTGKSTHQAACETRKVLKEELDFLQWKPHHMQKLTPEDGNHRMEYGELMLGSHEDLPQPFENILWSDKAIFHVGGFINQHSCHYWAHSVTFSCGAEKRMSYTIQNLTHWKNWKHGFGTLSPMSHTTSCRRLWVQSPAV
jgi:hypothetical protein